MAEWLYEEGIGEVRAALVERGVILEAQVERDDRRALAGAIVQGKLIRTLVLKKRGIVRLDGGEEALLEPIPPRTPEGSSFLVEILRSAIAEEGRDKLAKVRFAQPGSKARPGPSLLQRIRATGLPIIPCPAHEEDRLEAHGWSELMEEAASGEVGSEAAALRIFPTPAMTLIDIDGSLPPAQLGPKGAKLAGLAIRRMGISGSIGIDLPTMNNKDERMIAAAQIDKVLPLPFERTAVNGFGFVQIIRKRERASLMEMLREDPVLTATLALLRRAERHGVGRNGAGTGAGTGGGAIILAAAPILIDRLHKTPEWTALLETRRGGPVTLRADAGLPISAGHAQ